jgi:hypothetical protein
MTHKCPVCGEPCKIEHGKYVCKRGHISEVLGNIAGADPSDIDLHSTGCQG